MSNETVHLVLDRLLDPLGRCLTPDAARKIIDLRADTTVQQRVDELADKSTAGTLTAEERGEYEAYVAAGTLVAVLQSKARAFLSGQTAA
jgi:hypothetical protein